MVCNYVVFRDGLPHQYPSSDSSNPACVFGSLGAPFPTGAEMSVVRVHLRGAALCGEPRELQSRPIRRSNEDALRKKKKTEETENEEQETSHGIEKFDSL
ncbi:hypothetical protein AVEN_158105-1 [Araneus ventricosus]|uniref:Uncharacterized protein n=1 Tax=Araneus ventricosus TaxID=182803 RepID=A0A4Y2GR48_ARAVE|nr:hypothetical protein AVEN_158105-1 [Araneus ventricosus]